MLQLTWRMVQSIMTIHAIEGMVVVVLCKEAWAQLGPRYIVLLLNRGCKHFVLAKDYAQLHGPRTTYLNPTRQTSHSRHCYSRHSVSSSSLAAQERCIGGRGMSRADTAGRCRFYMPLGGPCKSRTGGICATCSFGGRCRAALAWSTPNR